eukprot:3861646-Karenia_brevis.AAC.1
MGCSPEGHGDRWVVGMPPLTWPAVRDRFVLSLKVKGYSSSWEDPNHEMNGQRTEPILIPRG